VALPDAIEITGCGEPLLSAGGHTTAVLRCLPEGRATVGQMQVLQKSAIFPNLRFRRRLNRRFAATKRGARRRGQVAEWSNVPDSKSGVRASVPWVRIPPCPPTNLQNPLIYKGFFFFMATRGTTFVTTRPCHQRPK